MLISASTEAGRELSLNFLARSVFTTRRNIGCCGDAVVIVLIKGQNQDVKGYHIEHINCSIVQTVNKETITDK